MNLKQYYNFITVSKHSLRDSGHKVPTLMHYECLFSVINNFPEQSDAVILLLSEKLHRWLT